MKLSQKKKDSKPSIWEIIWMSFSVGVFVLVIAYFFPILNRPVEALICEREIVNIYVPAPGRKRSDALEERKICLEEGGAVHYGKVKGKSRDVTTLYYLGIILFYGGIFFAVVCVSFLLSSNRDKNKS